jgi:nucleoside-diphosphate-sugar epimerase
VILVKAHQHSDLRWGRIGRNVTSPQRRGHLRQTADIARGLVTLAEHREADGEIWHMPAAEPLIAQEFFDLVFEAAGRPTPAKA